MRFIITMVVPPISRGAGKEISGHSPIETNETPESLGQVRKNFADGAHQGVLCGRSECQQNVQSSPFVGMNPTLSR